MNHSLFAFIFLSSIFTASSYSQKPNIVFFYIDDMGWTDVGFMGSTFFETPRIDKMASEGMVFNSAYSNAPNCAPARAALMSGQYAPRTGVYTVSPSTRGASRNRKLIPTSNTEDLDINLTTLAQAFKDGGYATGHFGKWHLGNGATYAPTNRGFDVNFGGDHRGNPGGGGYFCPYNNLPNLGTCANNEYLTDRLTTEVNAFIDANKDKPFFVYLPHFAVHTPIQGKSALVTKYQNKSGSNGQSHAAYGAMVESVDESVGSVLDQLEQLNLTQNTIVIFFSDNGGHANYTNMIGLRGSKGMLYEGGIKEPLIFKWPGQIAAGTTNDVPVIGVDFFPTLLEAAGLMVPNQILDGESFMPLLKESGSLQRKAIHWHYPVYLESYNANQGLWRTTPGGSIRLGDYKLIEYFEFGQLELYNLVVDMDESDNLALTEPGKVYELRQAMTAWRDSINAPVPTELNPNYNPDSQPTGYVTYAEVLPLLKIGCRDTLYEEYDATANAHEPTECKNLKPVSIQKIQFQNIFEIKANIISIKMVQSYDLFIYDLTGNKVFNSMEWIGNFNLGELNIQGLHFIKIRVSGIEKIIRVLIK